MELKRDTTLQGGRYRIIEPIGHGGFGVTYLAEQVMAKRKVCIKEFFPMEYYRREGDSVSLSLLSDSFKENMLRFKAKFVKEAQTIATLNHGNIIPIYDVFEENNTAYYVMEYIEGESLSARVKRCGAMDECAAVAYIKQVASALEHIHHQQIMHLDVKPGNIMVRMRDDQAILIDFGLSKHYDVESGDATSTALVGVSHGFAPIEQYKQGGVNRFSPETDIYSLGATLYYLVTGSVPPQAVDIADDGLPPLPSHLSSGMRKAIERSMADKRKDRPHTIKEFLTLIEEVNTATTAPSLGDEKTRIISPNAEPERTILPMSEEMQREMPREMPRDTQREKSRDIIDFLLNFKWILLVFVAIAAIFMLRYVFAFSFMYTIIFMMFVVCAIFLAGIVYFKYLRKRK